MESQNYQDQLQMFSYLKQQRDAYQGQLEYVNAILANILNTKATLENLKEGVEVGDEILVPIGGIVNIKATIKDTEKVLVAVTQDVIIEKDLDGAIEFLEKRIEQHNKEMQFMRTQLQNFEVNLQKTSQFLQKGYLQK
ncbi:MAG: prefoldin subunit alpha [Candidatus Lokiarchaeota archaeon]|nr:prefoldin subunit alpha [Candidatus Lokiarchaeota archaeon]MCK4381796.1 prefoldin subunit alpha [Candidatus Lokiarchaeota archaeon]